MQSEWYKTIKVGDRIKILTAKHWLWRRHITHWAHVEQVQRYVLWTGTESFAFYVRWEHRKFGIFPSHDWIECTDVWGIQRD